MLLNGNRNWNIPVYECLIRLNYHSHIHIFMCVVYWDDKSTKIIPVVEYNSLYLHYKIVSKNETE